MENNLIGYIVSFLIGLLVSYIWATINRKIKPKIKVLPYLMKLACFPNYLGIDKMKIRDSPQYRKEIFNFIGSQTDNLKELIEAVANECEKIDKERKK